MSNGWRGIPLVCPRCRGAIEERAPGAACRSCGSSYLERDGILELLSGSPGVAGYDPHYFHKLHRIEDRHFWYVGRRRAILAALLRSVPDLARRRLFDVGCGSGGLLEYLGRSGIRLAGACDVHTESLRLVRQRTNVPLVLLDEGQPPPLDQGLDLVGMFDVLEHVDDDVAMLRSVHDALCPGGVLVLTVPAHQWLFDEMDELAFHRRRYTRPSLRRALGAAGFEVRLLSHFMSFLVPVLWPLRTVGRWVGGTAGARDRRELEFRVVPGVNGAMRAVLAVERAVMTVARIPFGSSLVAVASRRER